MKVLIALCALVALQCTALPLDHTMRFKNIPPPIQDHQGTGEAEKYKKGTPGAHCTSFDSCEVCAGTSVCVWLPTRSACVEARDQARVNGIRDCAMPYTSETIDEDPDEMDDYSVVDVDIQTNTAIAALKSGEDVYAVADDADGDRGFAEGGLDFEHPASAAEYAGLETPLKKVG